ncbi:efflux RND transporter periplasmic adaptor subunit [Pseudoalteromonas luteoviolacea]|uniref:CusB-like barrel-sandwich hybrid domain-containing protein n=1 Tax=Pseudoalteromonas luteoviolacea DSM 6061 TaxID=1365250 RepID=A0A166WAM2_9GAMM|nr:efflux RND transporter periplasmic adaptor subunit [Pseudoalteromonas luteoviolacea]KZN36681.1 hypothetical protein N475_17295 [Pseudoalteromonas luteoviolacea DSM 6061]MBE0390122.1 hypothetical protein [Pseudoalteromonas luteoviolacea DSM 6061]
MSSNKYHLSLGKTFFFVLMTGLVLGCEDKTDISPQKHAVDKPRPVTYAKTVPAPSKVFYGKIQSINGYDMASFNNGRVASMYVKEGQTVKKGQLLANLYSPSLDAIVSQASAKLNAAIAASVEAETESKRVANLYVQNLTPIAMLEKAQRDARIAKENVQQAQAQLIQAKNDLQDISIYAPEDGLVAKLYARKGLFVAASEPILRLEQAGGEKVVFSVPEQDAVKLQVGNRVEIFVRSLKRKYQGTVSEKALPQVAGPSLFSVTIELEKGQSELLGLTAQLRMPLTQKPVYAIDSAAVRFTNEGQGYLLDNTYQQYAVDLLASRQDKLLVSAPRKLNNIPFSTAPEPTIDLNLMTAKEREYE